MAMKYDSFSFINRISVDTSSESQYSNLNLNQNYQSSLKQNLSSKNEINDSKKDFESFDVSQAKKDSWKKFNKSLSSHFINADLSDKKAEYKNAKCVKNSTLSLHIAAYENFKEALVDADFEKIKYLKTKSFDKTRDTVNQNLIALSSVIQNPFEFPRQQENDETRTPEVVQFKASQKLLNPNTSPLEPEIRQKEKAPVSENALNDTTCKNTKMEGIPKVPMISPDMKIPDDPMPADWIPKLREYIFTHYNDDPSKFNEAFKELQSMRYHACRYSADTESICIMKRYYAQLQMMKSRFPMETNEPVAVSFAWSDRSCDMAVGAAYEDINYEICCIMYNIGAAHATIGMNETRSDEDSRKNAFSNFQCASWPFECLRDKLNASKFASSNFEPELLTFFSQILLVQAQECLIEKAISDNRTNVIVSKLARYAAETYFELKIRLDQDTLSDYILNSKLKTWKRLCEAKAHFYEAIKRYYLGQQCCEDEKHGESVAHLAAALEQIKEAQKVVQKDKRESESMKQAISFALDIITQKEAKVRKENDFVYHDRVPKAEDLTQVEPVTKAKAIAFDPFKRDTCGDDLFAALLPANVLKGVSLYSEEKAKLKRGIIQTIEKKDTDLEQHLLSLQLSQLNLDQNLDEMRLPEELLQASAAFTAQPHALFDLLDQLNVVATKSSEAEIKLTDLRHRLLNVKCPQLEEDQGFKVISTKVNELMDHHIQARANNSELQKALASQSEQLKLLALPLTELAKNICDKIVNVSETPEGKRLREMVEKVEEMRKGRIQLFENLKTDLENDDITSKILAEKDFSMDSLFEKELKKHDKAVRIIEMNLNAQDKILNALTEANANFAECRRDIVENNEKRRSQCVSLITAYQVFTGVKEKTEAATTFYNQLFALINALDKSVTGMEDSFKGERERHEEQKRILAEKTKLYRERTAMESSNDQQLPTTTTERRRPKLGDYMAFYRNKMAGSQPQSLLNGSINQQYLPPSTVSPDQQQNLPFSSSTASSFSQQPPQNVTSQPQSVLNGSTNHRQYLPPLNGSSSQHPFSSAPASFSQQHPRNVLSQPLFNGSANQQHLPPSTVSFNQQQNLPFSNVPTSYSEQQRQPPPNVTSQPESFSKNQQYVPHSNLASYQEQRDPFSSASSPHLQQQQPPQSVTSQPQSPFNGFMTPQHLPPSTVSSNQQQHVPFSSAPTSNLQQQQPQHQNVASQPESFTNGSTNQQYVLPGQQHQSFSSAPASYAQQQQQNPSNVASQPQSLFSGIMSPQHLNELSSQQQRDPFSSVSSPRRLQQQQQNPPNVATSQPLFNNLMSTQHLPPSTISSNQQQHVPFSSAPTSNLQQQQAPQTVTIQPQSLFNGLTNQQNLPPSPLSSNQQQNLPFSSVPASFTKQQQQQPQSVTSQQQSVFNGTANQQYLLPSTVSSNQQQHLPLSSVPTSYSEQQRQPPPNVTSQSQSLFNGLMSPQHLPHSPVPSNQQQHIPFSNAPGSYSQQPTSNASKLPPKVALVNPQGVSKLSIAPSPYANMYKKPKAPVSNVPGNSPWHRNTETNSSPFEKK